MIKMHTRMQLERFDFFVYIAFQETIGKGLREYLWLGLLVPLFWQFTSQPKQLNELVCANWWSASKQQHVFLNASGGGKNATEKEQNVVTNFMAHAKG